MSGSYCADLRQAADVVAALTAVERELDEVMVDLRWRVAHLHGTWDGRSADSHLVVHQEWAAGYVDMQRALSSMRQALHSAASSYAEAASANVVLWRAVR